MTIFYISLDVNECLDEANNNCDEQAECQNNVGSYACVCVDGYEGDGVNCDGINIH